MHSVSFARSKGTQALEEAGSPEAISRKDRYQEAYLGPAK